MAEEEKSSKLELSKGRIAEAKAPPSTATSSDKFSFVKKSAFKAGTKDAAPKSEFKFSFNVDN